MAKELGILTVAVVTMAFRARDFPATEGSGFLAPPVDGRTVKAATFSFAKWDWVREAGDDVLVMRCSIGRHREEAVLQRPDDELVVREDPFAGFFLRDELLTAVATIDNGRDLRRALRLLGQRVDRGLLADPATDLRTVA